jgi:Dockerin type I domain
MRRFLLTIGCVLLTTAGHAHAAFTFDDIQYWIGSGTNRAAIAIDWSDGSTMPPALIWGYRWNGTATGRDMLTAIVTADNRLYAKFGGSPGSEVAVYGLGYDANNNGQFAIDDDTSFDAAGNAYGSAPFFPASSTEGDDYYAEGWTFGFWHYGLASADPFDGGAWVDSQQGMASRTLVDGAWDSWTFSPTFNFMAFAQNPQAAVAPFTNPPGDFNGDGRVDANDYNVWKSAFGSTTQLAADGNHDGIVDAADYAVWRSHLSMSSAMSSTALGMAEPSSLLLAFCSLGGLWLIYLVHRKECV